MFFLMTLIIGEMQWVVEKRRNGMLLLGGSPLTHFLHIFVKAFIVLTLCSFVTTANRSSKSDNVATLRGSSIKSVNYSRHLVDASPTSSVAESNLKTTVLFNSTVYISGCTRGYLLAAYLPALLANIDIITSYWSDWRLCVYADNASAAVLHTLNNPKIDILYESIYRHNNLSIGRYRTERIALGRNACLHKIRRSVLKRHHHLNDTYMIVFDLDDINAHPLDAEVFHDGIENISQWDVLSFNR